MLEESYRVNKFEEAGSCLSVPIKTSLISDIPSLSVSLPKSETRGSKPFCSSIRSTRPSPSSSVSALLSHESEKLSGPDGLIYPGTCRENNLLYKLNFSNVLRMDNSLRKNKSYSFCELGPKKGKISFSSEEFSKRVGDVVLWRRDYPAYHLACVIDDSEQKITHVVRGLDLFDATKIHTVLNSRLGLKKPFYFHHKLICDENGKRLAKRDDSKSLQKYRQEGFKASEIKEILGFK